MNTEKSIHIKGHGVIIMLLCTALFCLCFASAAKAQDHAGPAKTSDHQPAPMELQQVVVIGEKIDDYIKKNPAQIVSMDAREIEQRNFLQVNEVLGSMAGVDVKPGTSGMGTRISIRGGGGSGSVLVLVDGRPVSTMQYGGVDLGSIPIDIVKKITVFKPPVPVWLGPGSSAGAIYIETKSGQIKSKKIESRQTEKKSVKNGRVRILAGSYGLANVSATCRSDADDSDYMISGGVGHNDGKRDNSKKDQGNLSIHYGKAVDLFKYQVNAKGFISDHGVSGPTYNPTPNAHQRYEKASLDVKLDGMAQQALDYDVKAYLDVKKLEDTANNGDVAKLDAFTTGFGTNFFITNSAEKNEFRFGTLAEHSRVDHTLSGKHERNMASFHGVYTLRSAPFNLTTGLRSDYTSDFHFSPGGNAGVSYELSEKTIVKGNAGYSENIPSFGQLYQPSHGCIDQVRGNPDLEKEKIVSLSLGITHTFENKNELEFSLFRTDTRDLIKYQRGIDLISRPDNINRAYKQGLETSVRFHLTSTTDLDLNHIWQKTENKDNGKNLSYAPEHTLKVILKTKFKTGTKLEITARHYSDQFTDTLNTESEKIKTYITTDAKIIHPVLVLKKKAQIFVHIHNLFDTDFESHYGYPDDGLKLQAGLNINF
ncbi:TonB-dependent receptor plug domain-containing protein [Desulfobacula phenolica]|uniref:Iron complex outermembrane recepter protein n=1 Tax=Desulfobacula phenolica TaxID=90732 RepID=A0A1H2HK16_9BACT|nr:TonB-dependent receptor [Desulfobacula phenolica]SDU32175.1 iron complex outermembrane recepter protein [Desulfobacula phenolica]